MLQLKTNFNENQQEYEFMEMLHEILNSSKYLEIIKENERKKTKEEAYLDIKELQTRWKCSYTTAYEFMHSKMANSFKAGKKLIVPLSDVIRHEEFLKLNK